MSRAVAQLPEGYRPIYEIDLQKNKKMSWILNLSSVALGAVMGIVAHQIVNISGAMGDFFVTVRFSALPAHILVFDRGVGMTVYSK